MNRITATFDKSDYQIYPDFLNFHIDGCWLDEILERIYPENGYKGLVPTLLSWLENPNEKEVVWSRIYPQDAQKEFCPILMCPDDCDFSCIIVIAEVENCGDVIKWHRLGLDKTKAHKPEDIGTDVNWLNKVPALAFNMQEYAQMLLDFKNQNKIDGLDLS